MKTFDQAIPPAYPAAHTPQIERHGDAESNTLNFMVHVPKCETRNTSEKYLHCKGLLIPYRGMEDGQIPPSPLVPCEDGSLGDSAINDDSPLYEHAFDRELHVHHTKTLNTKKGRDAPEKARIGISSEILSFARKISREQRRLPARLEQWEGTILSYRIEDFAKDATQWGNNSDGWDGNQFIDAAKRNDGY